MAANESPSWLSEEPAPPSGGGLEPDTSTAPPPAAAAPAPASGGMSSMGTSAGVGAAADGDADSEELPGIILIMRLANMGIALTLIALSIVVMITLPPISAFVLAIYATCGGLLICCLETQLRFVRVLIAINFGFLFNSVWRFGFYVLLGSIAWSFRNLFGRVVGIAYIVVAIFNTYVLCRYPSYRRMREKIAEEEDKRIEARISKQVKAQAARQILGGQFSGRS